MTVGNQVMAEVHARFWGSPALCNHDWLPDHQFWFQGSTDTLSSFHRNVLQDYELRVELPTRSMVARTAAGPLQPMPSEPENPWREGLFAQRCLG